MRRTLEWLHENSRAAVLLVLSVLALAMPVASKLPGLRDWLAEDSLSAQLALVMIGLLSIFLIFGNRELKKKLDSMLTSLENKTELLIASVHGVEVRTFKDSTEQILYIAGRIRSAKDSVSDLSWVARRPRYHDRPNRKAANKAYHAAIRDACKRIQYREIFVFNRVDRVEVMQTRLAEKMPLYSCRYFDDEKIPRLQFLIIDKEEVLLFGSYGSNIESRCAIRQRQICEAFMHYYDQLWDAADILKEGPYIDEKKKDQIVARSTSESL